LLLEHRPSLVTCEDDLRRPWTQILRWVAELDLESHVVVATAFGSVSSAVRAIKMGVSAYVEKPFCALQIVDSLSHHPCEGAFAPGQDRALRSLHRLRWDYINATLDSTGTIAAAADRLGLDRRSLRRMLSKYPPAR
jgi:two-component system response regulator RegA